MSKPIQHIPLPERFPENFGSPLKGLLSLIFDIHEFGNSHKIVLDYSNAAFTNPLYTLSLPLLVKMFERKGIEIILESEFKQPNVSSYMSLLQFPEGVCPEQIPNQGYEKYLEGYKHKTYIPILNFPTAENEHTNKIRDNFLSAINSIITHQANLDSIMRSAIMYLIDEGINNIIHHAQDERGYILAQVYPSNGYMEICIADIGRTLLQSYEQSGRHNEIHTHLEAMSAALNGRSTKSDNVDRGFGISTSKKMLTEGLNGKYFLFSGNVFNIHTSEINDITELPPEIFWQRAYLAMRIPLVAKAGFNPSSYYE